MIDAETLPLGGLHSGVGNRHRDLRHPQCTRDARHRA